jgi:hypothetical protein
MYTIRMGHDDTKESIYEKLECISDQFLTYHFTEKVGREDISKLSMETRIYMKISVNIFTSKILSNA